MELFDELKTMGVDIEDGLRRLGGNEGLYKRLMGTFVKTIKEHYVPVDFDASDCASAIEHTHAIKGTSGNLSLTPIYTAYSEIVDLLRTGKPEEARALLEKVMPVQEQIISCIEKYM